MNIASGYQFLDDWIIQDQEPYADESEVSKATVFAVSNGYMGSRGAPEFVLPDLKAIVGNHINGIYDSPSSGILDREMINLPDWRYMKLEVDGETVTLDHPQVSYVRRLDMRRGMLIQDVKWTTYGGKHITLNSERLVHASRLHLGIIRWTMQSDQPCDVWIQSYIETAVNNRFADNHFADTQVHSHPKGGAVEVATIQEKHRVRVATVHQINQYAVWSSDATSTQLGVSCQFHLTPNQPATLEKWVSIYDSRFSEGNLESLCSAELNDALVLGFDAILREHTEQWARYWSASDVVIEGDPAAQAAMRFCIFHLLGNAPHSEYVSISARGLQGQDYWGSIFWDCEIYVLPMLIYTQPASARRCVLYRYHTLDGARRKASGMGFHGAYFAWQSQETGDETCALYVFDDPLTGKKIRSYFADEQIHISADIVYALWQYTQATGDTALLYNQGVEIACEVARFFVSRATYNPQTDQYGLHNVLGPDEYHERISNNVYTNVLAQFSIQTALTLLERQAKSDLAGYNDILARLNVEPSEIEQWQAVAEKLVIPSPDPKTELIPQFDGYFTLEDASPEVAMSRLGHPEQYPGGLLGPFQNTQSVKQADVVLLLYLLRNRYAESVKAANWHYYEPRTAHHSSLSPMAYALVAADLNMTEWAYRYFMQTANMDLVGSGPHWNLGVHTAAMGGAWLVVVHGFCRIDLQEDGVHILGYPLLPEHWQRIAFNFYWHGRLVLFETTGKETRLAVEQGDVPVIYPGGKANITPDSPFTLIANEEAAT